MLKGIDVSGAQPTSVWKTYKPDFGMIKATEGVGYVTDALIPHFIAASEYFARAHKPMLYGFYHYARPETGNTAKSELDTFLGAVGHFAGEALYALDWEEGATSMPKEWAYDFLKQLGERTQSDPFIYMSASVARQPGWEKVQQIARLWVAAYDGGRVPSIGSWTTYSMYQWTDEPLDQDRFPSDAQAWKRLADKRRQPKKDRWELSQPTPDELILKRKNA